MFKKSIKTATTELRALLNPQPREQYPDWRRILNPDSARWNAARAAARNGPKILIATSAGFDEEITTVDSIVAAALTLRGADVHILLCDETLPACLISHNQRVSPDKFAIHGPAQHLCGQCFVHGYKVFRSLGLRIHRYGQLISQDDWQKADEVSKTVPTSEIQDFRFDGLEIGEHALAGTLRYFARGDLNGEPHGESILRRYLKASLLSMFAMRRLLSTVSFRSVFAVHGIYVPEGIFGAVARNQNVRTVCWNPAYRKQTVILSHDDTYHRTMLSEPTSNWENLPWSDETETEILDYLKSRWYGSQDWIGYTQDWSGDVESVAAGLGIDFSRPCVGLLTNVIWDAQINYRDNAFPNMLQWVLETIKYFAKRPDLHLIVRVHPAEVRGWNTCRQMMVDEIKRAIPNLPKNVFIVPPESSMNTYAAMLKCNAVLIYGTKTGVELSSFGVPIIVAGEAWIRNKGITLDASSSEDYLAILDRLPLQQPSRDATIQRARKYAYHFFFRRMIPLPFLVQTSTNSLFELKLSDIDELLPGKFPGLDVICNGILNGDEFIYPAEMYRQNVAATGKFSAEVSSKLSSNQTAAPLVSVIIPTQNSENSLRPALDSIAAQEGIGNNFRTEVIVVDYSDSDGASKIVCAYAGVRYIRSSATLGLSEARNLGIRSCHGRYVAFLDDDTVWLRERLRAQITVLENYPQFGVAYGQSIATGFGQEFLWPHAESAPAGSAFREFLMEEYTCLSLLLARKEAYEKAGHFDRTLRSMSDYDMLLRLAFAVPFAFVAGPVARLSFSRDRIWSDRIQQGVHKTELPYIISKVFAPLPNTPEFIELSKAVASRWFSEIASRLDKPEGVDVLRAHVLQTIKDSPWMLTDPAARDLISAYACKVLINAIGGNSKSMGSTVRSFCQEFRNIEAINVSGNSFAMQRFLGNTLTQTASQVSVSGFSKAVAYVAAYALIQDPTQFPRQFVRGIRRILSALGSRYGFVLGKN